MSHKRESHLSIHIEDILLKRNSIIGREASQDLRGRLQGRELLTVHVNRISIEPTRNLKIFKIYLMNTDEKTPMLEKNEGMRPKKEEERAN